MLLKITFVLGTDWGRMEECVYIIVFIKLTGPDGKVSMTHVCTVCVCVRASKHMCVCVCVRCVCLCASLRACMLKCECMFAQQVCIKNGSPVK